MKAPSANPFSIVEFKTHLTKSVIFLAKLAEGFRPVERMFMTHTQNPSFLAALYSKKGDATGISMSQIPTNAIHISYHYDKENKRWQESRKEETTSHSEFKKRLNTTQQLVTHSLSANSTATQTFLTRQQTFYTSFSSTSVSDTKKTSVSSKTSATNSVTTKLTAQFSAYPQLICGSVEEMAKVVAEKLTKAEMNLTKLCDDIIISLFIGRDIIQSKTQQLVPQIEGYIDSLATIFSEYYQSLQPKVATTSTITTALPATHSIEDTKPQQSVLLAPKRRHSAPTLFTSSLHPHPQLGLTTMSLTPEEVKLIMQYRASTKQLDTSVSKNP